MNRFWQIVCNVILYGFLGWLLYNSTIKEWDPWFAFVVAFLLLLSIVVSLIPGLRASQVSPGDFPFRDDE